MNTTFKLLTWDIEEDCIFSREFKYENEAIETAQALYHRRICRHHVIDILRTKKNRTQVGTRSLGHQQTSKNRIYFFLFKKRRYICNKIH